MKIILIKQPKNKITIAKMLKIFALKKEIVYEIFCDLFLCFTDMDCDRKGGCLLC